MLPIIFLDKTCAEWLAAEHPKPNDGNGFGKQKLNTWVSHVDQKKAGRIYSAVKIVGTTYCSRSREGVLLNSWHAFVRSTCTLHYFSGDDEPDFCQSAQSRNA